MKKICIYANDDGTYMVEEESQGQEMPEGQEPQGEQMAEGGQTFESVEEALDAARAMLGESSTEPMMEGQEDAESAFRSGFAQARGNG